MRKFQVLDAGVSRLSAEIERCHDSATFGVSTFITVMWSRISAYHRGRLAPGGAIMSAESNDAARYSMSHKVTMRHA